MNLLHRQKWNRAISIAALLLFFWLAVNTAVSKSMTNDEPTHLLRGYALWTTGALQYQGAHTPFSHWVIGSLIAADPSLPDLETLPSWGGDRVLLAREMLWESSANTYRVLFLGRLPVIWLGMILGGLIAQWSRALWGKDGAAAALILFALAPNWLGMVSLATTDGPLTVTYFAAVFTLWHYQKRPSRLRWLLAGVGLGLALGTKITALLLLPLTFILFFTQWHRGKDWKRPFWQALSLMPLALIVLWACYGFEWGYVPGIPIAVPAPTYVSNFTRVQTHVEESHLTYLLGERARKGWWYYFIVAFLIKTPAAMLILLVTATFFLFWQRTTKKSIYVWLPAGALFAAASATGLNIGYRHILPTLPLIWMMGAYGFAQMRRGTQIMQYAAFFLLIWVGFGTLRQHPHHLAYFNTFAGGSENGYRYLSDSNIDWGQDLYLLAAYAANSDRPIHVSYNGVEDVSRYEQLEKLQMDAETGFIANFNPANPAPGIYAISVTHYHGTTLREPDIFDWFRRQTPVAQLGHSIFIFDVPAADQGSWIGHCLAPTPAVDPAAAENLVGQSGMRHLYFDCRTSWIFPHNGTPGWIIVPPRGETFFSLPLSVQPLPVFIHAATNSSPAYDILYWPGRIDVAGEIRRWPGNISLADGDPLKRPFSIANTAQFLGYQQSGRTWLTAWQAETKPTSPLSIMGHLHDTDAGVLVADGLGFSSEQWEAGDVVIQKHQFEEGETADFFATGLYEYLSGDTLSLTTHADTTFQLAPLPK